MHSIINTQKTEHIEKQVLHDILRNPELMTKVYKTLESEDFETPKNRMMFDKLCDIYKQNRKVSIAHAFDAMGSNALECIEDPIHPTPAFFDDFVEVLRERRISREIDRLLDDKSRGDITSAQVAEEIKALEKKRLGNLKVQEMSEAISDYYELYAERVDLKESGQDYTILTGLPDFDRNIGLTRGELITLAARTGIGKSAFALNLALRVAEKGRTVLFVSIEMSKEQIFERVFAYETGIECECFKNAEYETGKFGELAERITEKYKTFKPLYAPQATSGAICRIARNMPGVDLVVVDYLQILKDQSKETNTIRIGEMTGRFKRLAGELMCPVICVSQVNRDASKGLNKEPEIHQLRDSGSIEQDSDKVLFLNRDKDDNPMEASLYIAKNRSGKEGLRLNYRVDMSIMKFNELINT
jgi:replicative DNA helicase